ncbi:MAG: hypothetical protein MHPSP_000166 [Paramarteilia canceri]
MYKAFFLKCVIFLAIGLGNRLVNADEDKQHCYPNDFLAFSDPNNIKNINGPFTYIQSDTEYRLYKDEHNFLDSFTIEFTQKGTIHLQLWKRVNNRQFEIKKDEKFSAAQKGNYSINVNWEVEDGDFWGFSSDDNNLIPIEYTTDSKIRAIGDALYLKSDVGQHTFSVDLPWMFKIKVCTSKRDLNETVDIRSSARSGQNSYSCERRSSWNDTNVLNTNGPITYINSKKITSPSVILKDIEVMMNISSFITIQVWRKDTSNYEFVLTKEKTFYAKLGYNMIPVNMEMVYGEQWGFAYETESDGPIQYSEATSDSSYEFNEYITGIGSKRSYSSLSPTSKSFKISPCYEIMSQQAIWQTQGQNNQISQNQNFNQNYWQQNYQQQNYQQQNYQQQNFQQQNYQQQNYQPQQSMQSQMPMQQNQYVPGYNPNYGTNIFYPQQSQTKCYCTANNLWYSANSSQNGPYTYIDSDQFQDMKSNIEAFEIESDDDQKITLQLWRQSGYNSGSLMLVWEQDVQLSIGYQRIKVQASAQKGDRWGFVYDLDTPIPIKFYTDTSIRAYSFNYQIPSNIGQTISLNSAQVSFNKFKIRPCMCSSPNVINSGNLGNGGPFTTTGQINSTLAFTNGPSLNPTMQQSMYGYSSFNDINSCGQYLQDPGYLDIVGNYTYIDFNKLPNGRLNSINAWTRRSGLITFQIWRYDSSNGRFNIIFEKPAALNNGFNSVNISSNVYDGDLLGFSYMGSGLNPIQYKSVVNYRSFEINDIFSMGGGDNSITSYFGFSNMETSVSNSSNFGVETNCMNDGESTGPYNNKISGPYTYVGDFGELKNKCIESISYKATKIDSIVFFKVSPSVNGFVITDLIESMPTSIEKRNTKSVNWCFDDKEKLGFFYQYSEEVPIPFTYYWGESFEYPREIPNSEGEIAQLFETSKSFDIKICEKRETSSINQSYGGNSNFIFIKKFNIFSVNYQNDNGYNPSFNNNNVYINPYSQYNGNGQQQQYSVQSNNQFSYQPNYYHSQNQYGYYQRSFHTSVLNTPYAQMGGSLCLGPKIQPRKSMAGLQGPQVYFIDTPFQSNGRIKQIELEASMFSKITFILAKVDLQGQNFDVIQNIELNIYPGINTIGQEFIGWQVEPGFMIGYVSETIESPVTYLEDQYGTKIMNFNACLEDRIYNSPTSFITPNQYQSSLMTPNGSYNDNEVCSCYDNSFWPNAFLVERGPLLHIDGEGFRGISGFIEAFEVDAFQSGEIEIQIWRPSFIGSDQVRKVFSMPVTLRAGYQRIDGISANFQDGDYWGFQHENIGQMPINYMLDPNFYGYQSTNENSLVSNGLLYLYNLDYVNKRFKIRPCICKYGSANNNNVIDNYVNPYIQNNPSINNNYLSQGSSSTYNSMGGQNYNPYTSYLNNGQQGYNNGFNNNQNYNQISQMMTDSTSFPTTNYEYCYGNMNEPGTLTKFGPYTYINFEPLPEGRLDSIEFSATFPSTLTWQIWRFDSTNNIFKVVDEQETTFGSGSHTIRWDANIESRDLLGFHYSGVDEIPIKYKKFVGAQSFEDYSGTNYTIDDSINPPDSLVDQIFNYKACMSSVSSSTPLQTTSDVGGYGFSYSSTTPGYYNGSNNFYQSNNTPMGYDYSNNYSPLPSGISYYNPVQPYNYNHYNQIQNNPQYTYGYSTMPQYQAQQSASFGNSNYGYNQNNQGYYNGYAQY